MELVVVQRHIAQQGLVEIERGVEPVAAEHVADVAVKSFDPMAKVMLKRRARTTTLWALAADSARTAGVVRACLCRAIIMRLDSSGFSLELLNQFAHDRPGHEQRATLEVYAIVRDGTSTDATRSGCHDVAAPA